MSVPGGGWARWRSPVGFPVVALCLWLAHPTFRWVILGSALAFLGLLFRAWAAGYLRKWQALAVSGPYGRTRNPLYFGSALMAVGLAMASGSWLAVAVVVAYFAVFYPIVVKREAAELRQHYGEPYEAYARSVPLFWPRLRAGGTMANAERFSFAQYMRNREYRVAIGYVLLAATFAAMALWRK